jgi:hypothetical protein
MLKVSIRFSAVQKDTTTFRRRRHVYLQYDLEVAQSSVESAPQISMSPRNAQPARFELFTKKFGSNGKLSHRLALALSFFRPVCTRIALRRCSLVVAPRFSRRMADSVGPSSSSTQAQPAELANGVAPPAKVKTQKERRFRPPVLG